MNTHLTHPRFPRLLTAAALATAAPFAAADETWSTDQDINDTRTISGNLVIDGADPGPVVNVSIPGQVSVSEYIYVGSTNAHNATLNITDGGIVIGNGEFRVAGSTGSQGKVVVSGDNSSLTAVSALVVGYYGSGTLDIIAGGKVSTTSNLIIGYGVGGNGTLTVGGTNSTLDVTLGLYVYGRGTGTLNIIGGGTVNAGSVVVGNWTDGDGTLNLFAGGTLATQYIKKGIGTGTSVLNFNGGTIRATATSANFFQDTGTLSLNNASLSAGAPALVFDSNGNDVTIQNTFAGAGGLTKTGGGTLELTGAHTYTGATTVSGGAGSILKVTGTLNGGLNHTGDIVLAGGSKITFAPAGTQTFSGVLSGTGTVRFDSAQSVIVAGTLNPGSIGLPVAPGTLTFSNTNGVAFSAGAKFVVDLIALGASAGDGSDLLIVEGGNLILDGSELAIRRASTFPLWGAPGGDEIVIAKVTDGGKIEGMFANADPVSMEVTDPNGRRAWVSVRANAEGGEDLILTVFPEPSTYALCGGAGALLLALWRKRRRKVVK
jgi:T5SS/PEP-CTERM-associated repeat protein/autotransporter-associated beta strand protein